ncbi:unnamed protein product [Sphagnum troendelagicum]|uniref:Uncharacterized protein n=1 Tax=Sphagnum troendelagicum TaxID=128251 RepID=A0ABP0TV09_9BRYO
MSVQAGYNGGVPITHEFFIREMSGKLNYVIAQELMPEMDEAKRIQYMDEKEVQYRKLAAKDLQPIPGFHLFVEWVKKHNLRRAAVTNSPRLNAEQVLTALKVTDFFELLVDSPSGVKAGVAAGSPTVGLLTGHPSAVLSASGASLLIKDYNDPVLWEALGEPCHKSGSQSCSTPLEQTASNACP